MNQSVKDELTQLEQLALGMQMALRGTSPQARAILNRAGFTKNQRIVVQRFTYVLVGACRKLKAQART